jgi:hypothetical protein
MPVEFPVTFVFQTRRRSAKLARPPNLANNTGMHPVAQNHGRGGCQRSRDGGKLIPPAGGFGRT